MVQALRGDVKDFWRYSTFSDWVKIGDFRTFFGGKNTVFWRPGDVLWSCRVHNSMQFM